MIFIILCLVWLCLPVPLILYVFYLRNERKKLEGELARLKHENTYTQPQPVNVPAQEEKIPVTVAATQPSTAMPPSAATQPSAAMPPSTAMPPSAATQPGTAMSPSAATPPSAAMPPSAATPPRSTATGNPYLPPPLKTLPSRTQPYPQTTAAPPPPIAKPAEEKTTSYVSANQPAPLPVFIPAPAPDIRKRRDETGGGTTMAFGVIFVVLAGLVFATTSWASMDNFVRIVTILVFSVVFFITSSIAERKLKLRNTGIAFYSLGSCFLPLTLFAAGYFRVFGDWFSLFGGGKFFLLAAAFALLSFVFAKGSHDYSAAPFSWSALLSGSATVISLLHLIPMKSVLMLAVSLFCFVLLLCLRKAALKTQSPFSGILTRLPRFAVLNAVAVSFPMLFLTGYSAIYCAALLLMACCYLLTPFSDRDEYFSAIPFVIFVSAAFYKLTGYSDGGSLVFMAACTLLMTAIVGFVPAFSEKLRKALFRVSFVPAFAALLFYCFDLMIESNVSPLSISASLILGIGTMISALRFKQNALAKTVNALSLVCLSYSLSQILTDIAPVRASVFSLIIISLIVIFAAFDGNGLRNLGTDVVFTFMLLISQYAAMITAGSGRFMFLIPVAGLLSFLGAAICSRRRKGFAFLAILSGISLISIMHRVLDCYLTDFAAKWIFFGVLLAWFAGTLLVSAVLAAKKSSSGWADYINILVPVQAGISFLLWYRIYPVYAIALIFVVFYAVSAFTGKAKYRTLFLVASYICSIPMTWSVLNYHISGDIKPFDMLLIGCFQSALFWALSELFLHFDKESKASRRLAAAASACLCATLMLSSMIFDGGSAYFALLLLLAVAVASCERRRFTLWLILPLMTFYFTTYSFAEDFLGKGAGCFVVAGLTMISLFLGRLMYPHKMIEKFRVDVYSPMSIMGILMLLSGGRISQWLVLPMFALWLLQTVKRPKVGKWNITVSVFILVIAWWAQPFVNIPELLELENAMLPLLLFCGAMALVWKNHKRAVLNLTYCVSVFAMFLLGFDACFGNSLIDSLIVAVAGVAILVVSLLVRRKRWLVLGAVSLSLMTISMARSFWTMFGWWTYLMLAGIVLIGVGVGNELQKKRVEEGAETTSAALKEWKW